MLLLLERSVNLKKLDYATVDRLAALFTINVSIMFNATTTSFMITIYFQATAIGQYLYDAPVSGTTHNYDSLR
ncbi:hypothetical protein A0U91_13960 [Acetobacter persici]|uniref:Uncharacterized protein n=1 Tax=Acetobacter persici TaxID=1076596 RepID=A0A1U9LH73_9PROT|nr:hypothetical protein A0U91_13960 [Acetobacter persici]